MTTFPARLRGTGLRPRCLCVLALAAAVACTPAGDDLPINSLKPGEPVATRSGNASFRSEGYEPATGDLAEVREFVASRRLLEGWTEALNGWVRLPGSVALVFRECGEGNAFYDPEASRIEICYELAQEFAAAADAGPTMTDEELNEAVLGGLEFMFYHEVGHALIHQLDLPTLGRPEDAADGLAAFVLVNAEDEDDGGGEVAAANGVQGLMALDPGTEESDLADEHSLSRQRYYNVLCWIHGSAPDEYAYLVDDGVLPAERAEGCAEEYAQLVRGWDRLLAPALLP